ncbi:glycosyltransferase family 4 protein [Streptomyces iranensis]|uniref:Iron(II)-dependent oxidoreductase n=1 Tax=Streptomyces iranensis TaxID=576784 RepID=A0A060ZYN2_9ACTN|nr:glycosyltransferase family 4 protein [Streptomyces iranensis]MBP2066200.1 iron(II)-dependent oxidoreductase [Streptomyces iranensis]CDR13042.1 predicted protein [Streptomyces iranensis]
MNIALVMLTYRPDEPAGIERALASLAAGLRELGHRAVIITAGSRGRDHDPDLLPLTSLAFPHTIPYEEIPGILADATGIGEEVRRLLREHEIDIACWGDAVSGLGFLNPAPPGTRTALMVHFPRADEAMRESLAHEPDAVVTVSPFMIDEAARAGLDSSRWHALPNALLCQCDPPGPDVRERLRRTAPVRVVARADPQKGVADLLRALPEHPGRTVQIVLARAGFELWPGLQDQVLKECRELADKLPDVEILPPLAWDEVQAFFAGAAVAVVPSTGPESFGNVAAEALSVGTPVVGFGLGHLPALIGAGGRTVSLGGGHDTDGVPALTGPSVRIAEVAEHMDALWQATTDLLDDAEAYHAAAREAPLRTVPYSPAAVAGEFLRMMAP